MLKEDNEKLDQYKKLSIRELRRLIDTHNKMISIHSKVKELMVKVTGNLVKNASDEWFEKDTTTTLELLNKALEYKRNEP